MLRYPVLALLAIGCTPAVTDPCGTCPTGTFCCLATCQALGTVCGGDAAMVVDAAMPVDAAVAIDAFVDPCASDGGIVASACALSATGPGVVHCGTGATDPCGASGRCVDWTASDGSRHGVCANDGQMDPCDPSTDHWQCVGTVERACVASPPTHDLGDAPPGWWGADDCRQRWSSDATCAIGTDGIARCTSPTDVACDPTTFVVGCDQICMDAPGTPMGGVLRPFCTGAGTMCVTTTLTTNGVTCVPIGATASTHAATAARVGLACVGGGIRMEEFGYEWTQACEPEHRVVGGTFTSVPTTCWMAPDGSVALCLTSDTVTCASETVAGTCADDTHSMSCVNWQQDTLDCATYGLTPSVCDPTTGNCAGATPCHAGWPFTETCAGPHHKWTLGTCTTGLATLAPCIDCRANAAGDGVDCG